VLALSLAVNPLLFLVAAPIGLAALVLGVLGVQRARESGLGKGQAVAGAITGGLATVAAALAIAGALTIVSAFRDTIDPSQDVAAESACARAENLRTIDGERQGGDYTLSGIQVCSDTFDDFTFSAMVRNDGVGRGQATLELQAVDAGGDPVGTGSTAVSVEPGASVRANFISFDDYRGDWSDVDVRISDGGS
jgi:hypothetical protein